MNEERASGPLGVYGAGGFGREVARSAIADRHRRFEPLCFVDDAETGESERRVGNLPVLTLDQFVRQHPEVPLVVAIGDPSLRRRVVEAASARGVVFATLVHESVVLAPSVEVGEGVVLCAGCLLTVDIRIAPHVHLNLACTIGHDARIEEFATIAPGVNLSGEVHVGKGAYIGTGASVINGRQGSPLRIGAGSVIGAGACVIGDTEPGTLNVGVPAKAVRRPNR